MYMLHWLYHFDPLTSMANKHTLFQLGWQPFFQQQLTLEEWDTVTVGRVAAQHRSRIELLTNEGTLMLPVTQSMDAMTTGDWLLLDSDLRFLRLLERTSLFSRKAAGTKVATQLIAANIDTVFIVCSMNLDFNLNRIERYLVMAHEAGVEAVIVLTKEDLCDEPRSFKEQASSINPMLNVVSVNALDPQSVKQLNDWCAAGKTVALLGSSGVGKSTLINTLSGHEIQQTNSIREDDDKGHHTTTSRTLHLLPAGGILLDTPGMREIQLADCERGVEEAFSEIVELAANCKFSDCSHNVEPGCAVRAAIEVGKLEQRRLSSYLKLMREQAFNQATLAEKRARDREFGRYVRSVMENKRKENR